MDAATRGLAEANRAFAVRYPGESGARQPVHSFYGGAHLFPRRYRGEIGSPGAGSARSIRARSHQPGASARHRSGAGCPRLQSGERKTSARAGGGLPHRFRRWLRRPSGRGGGRHAVQAGREVAAGIQAGSLPPFIGIRVKPLNEELRARGLRTMDLFLTALLGASGGRQPQNCLVTLLAIRSFAGADFRTRNAVRTGSAVP
jgi:hypothetical protein